MKSIASHLTEYKPNRSHLNFNSRSQETRQSFVNRINESRKGTKYKDVSVVQLNARYPGFAQLTTHELDVFYKQCMEYGAQNDEKKTFSRCFFGSLT